MRPNIRERLQRLEAASTPQASRIYVGDPAAAPPGTIICLPPKDVREPDLSPQAYRELLDEAKAERAAQQPQQSPQSQPETVELLPAVPAAPVAPPEPPEPRAVGAVRSIGSMWPESKGRLW